MVDIEPVKQFDEMIPLQSIKDNPACEGMLLTRKGQRLSVQPVEEVHFDAILSMAGVSRADL